MTGVVLRCPNCGTTRAATGECEACHEAQVRYHCTNHSPGLWLDGSACPQCAARFGDRPRPTPVPAPTPTPRVRTPVPAPRAAEPTPTRRHPRGIDSDGFTGRRPDRGESRRGRRGEHDVGEEHAGRVFSLEDLLRAAARARPVRPEASRIPETAPAGRGLGGCLLRLFFLVGFLFLVLFGGLSLFGGALLQMLGFY